MADYKKLLVWEKAHELAVDAHCLAIAIRSSKYAALRNQIIRASMSVPANIVEGREQKSEREFLRFLGYAAASAAELEYHVRLARDFGVVSAPAHEKVEIQITAVRKMLRGLINRIEASAVVNAANG